MSSATNANVAQVGQMLKDGGADQAMGGPQGAGLSSRQTRLNRLWSYYRCENYDNRRIAWDGSQAVDPGEREFVAQAGFIPAGYYDAGQTLPVEFRRPITPYYMARVIVNRFTGLLFSQRRHPKVQVSDDPTTEDWLTAVVEQCRLWAQMLMARMYGGAMGAVGVGFKFVSGKCQVEVHDARLCTPEFVDRNTLEVLSLEERYVFEDDLRANDGSWVKGKFWYRRVIDPEKDTVWPKVPVRDGDEPEWEKARHSSVFHNFGFCPVVWIQNKPLKGEIDGDADCHGAFDLIERCDALRSQAYKSTMANCDPTLQLSTDADMAEVTTGAGGAIKLEKGASAQFLEVSGSAATSAREQADELEEKVLTLVQCFLDTNTGGPSRTESEVEANYSAMIEQADIFREQYGEKGVKKLLEMILCAGRVLDKPVVERTEGQPTKIVRQVLALTPKVEVDEETGKIVPVTPRQIGTGQIVQLKWPPYFQPTAQDVGQAVIAAGQAKGFGLVDLDHAVRFIAGYFQVEDVKGLVRQLSSQKSEADQSLEAQMMARMSNPNAFGSKPGG